MNSLTERAEMELTTQQQNALNDLRHGDSPNGPPREGPQGTVLIDCETGTVRIERDGTLADGDAPLSSAGEPATVTVHVPDWTATTILEGSGWTQGESGEWIRPNGRSRSMGGEFGSDYYWQRDEALMLALDTVALGLISTVGA